MSRVGENKYSEIKKDGAILVGAVNDNCIGSVGDWRLYLFKERFLCPKGIAILGDVRVHDVMRG